MAGGASDTEAALGRLAEVLPSRAPDLWATFRPAVADRDLSELRRAVRPYELPEAVVSLLRWADGQEPGSMWWPSLECGPLLNARSAAEHYRFLCAEAESQWNPLWLPVAHEGWYQAAVEMTPDRPGVVLDGSFPDPEVRVVAPSLAAVLQSVADMAEAAIEITTPGAGDAHDRERRHRRDITIEARNDREGWDHWPYDRVIALERAGWPPDWRTAVGLPPNTDYPHPPSRPIDEVLREALSGTIEATVEGRVAERVDIDGVRGKTRRIRLEDQTGALHVLVPPDTPGAYWAAWLGRRIQVDLRLGPLALVDPADSMHADSEALEVRMSVQI